ncbi:hypothetical protein Ocin01_14822 [Orchesella cincta]|uniref:Protein quiver n=1 Tax=Orchesella cincta TaxID=48709 RepID=A0A1D2MFU5_ORCCI|nr:hypothetical protein Ocin01_14822 [Orchesella cincta]
MCIKCTLKCWVCNSRNDLGCGDPFDNSSFPISDCDAEFNKRDNLIGIKATIVLDKYCVGKRRYIGLNFFIGNYCDGQEQCFSGVLIISYELSVGEWRWIRSCAFLGEPGIGGDERYCKRRTGTFDIYQEDCLCRGKDGCNAGNSWQPSIGLVGVLTTISSLTILKLMRPFTKLVIL